MVFHLEFCNGVVSAAYPPHPSGRLAHHQEGTVPIILHCLGMNLTVVQVEAQWFTDHIGLTFIFHPAKMDQLENSRKQA